MTEIANSKPVHFMQIKYICIKSTTAIAWYWQAVDQMSCLFQCLKSCGLTYFSASHPLTSLIPISTSSTCFDFTWRVQITKGSWCQSWERQKRNQNISKGNSFSTAKSQICIRLLCCHYSFLLLHFSNFELGSCGSALKLPFCK